MSTEPTGASPPAAELPITGYVDRLSRRPGEKMQVHVSVRDPQRFRATLVRVLSADANPQGPGLRFERLAAIFDEVHAGIRHPIRLGSWGVAPGPALSAGRSYTWTALVWPGLLSSAPKVVFAHESENASLTVSIADHGVQVEASAGSGVEYRVLKAPLSARRWYRLWVSVNWVSVNWASVNWASVSSEQAELTVGIQPCAVDAPALVERFSVPALRLPSGGRFMMAARDADTPRDHFDGRIEDPAVLTGVKERWTDPLIRLSELGSSLVAGWDFSVAIQTARVVEIGPQRLSGVLKNLPTRAVRGVRWTGEQMCWTHCPSEYAAIHFHSEDLGDCEWPVAFDFTVPDNLRSGAYAFHLSCESGEDWIPFFVLPRRNSAHAPIAFIAPTFTYQAYTNHARGNYDEALRARVKEWGAYPYDPEAYPLYGLSTYNRHCDGSGVAYSSRLRPMLPMRPAFVSIHDVRGSGLRHYPADMHLLSWLQDRGFACDVITDEDLHEEGVKLLDPHRVVLTGTHPEYHSKQSLDAVRDYIDRGGHLAYLGGNGFYWRVGLNEEQPGVIEVRRAEGGIRAWAAEAGEYYQSLDGAYGGLWRRNGRDPQALVGVGFSVQGPFEGTFYRRTPESYDPQFAWLFKGIEGEIIGDYGLSGGGAAGYEMDRADLTLGTPMNAVVVARAVGSAPAFYPASEEILYAGTTVNGESVESLLRADMTYFETPAGGAVFSVGSITFCGSLWRDGFVGPVSQLLYNVIEEFMGRRARQRDCHCSRVCPHSSIASA